jgi:dTDP-4-dehydrorhamnose 3,5-epimerase
MFTKVPTTLADAYIVQPQVYGDARGFFVETYNAASFAEIDMHNVWIQDNHSKSKK